ncbi:dNMP kinase [Escherichia phage PSa2]|nr:dNMP kinase [Escherichia phage PSa2]
MSVLVGLHGEAGAGKDTVAELMIDWCNDTFPTCLSRSYSFAKPVYELASVILGVTPEFLGERRGKEIDQWFTVTQSQLERARDVWFKYGIDKFEDFSYVWPIFEGKYLDPQQLIGQADDALYSVFISPRKMLQLVGTELGRQLVHERIWLIILEQSIDKDDPDVAIVTDVRFPNEGELIMETNTLDMDSMLIKVESGITNKYRIETDHPSESGIPEKYISHKFENTFNGLDALRTDVYHFCDLELEPLVG